MGKLKKEIILTIKTKICKTKREKEKKKYMRNYYYERKNLLSHLINCVKELEHVCINK